MAVVTIVAAGDVGWMLAGCGDAVVTGAAATQYLCVIHSHRRYPYRRAVAVLADIGRQYVGWILAGRSDAVVAVTAVTNDAGVIEICG